MKLSPLNLLGHEKRWSLWLGAASLSFAVFVKITSELRENEVHSLDSSILAAVVKIRRPWLTGVAVDLTALGSITLVTVISLIVLCLLISLKDSVAAWQLLLNSLGAGIWTQVTKSMIERTRPDDISHLVQVSGFSYPSGHSLASASLYLTIAILAARHLPTAQARVVLFSVTIGVISLVGMSRVYLGVHYASDVASGVMKALALVVTGSSVIAACIFMVSRYFELSSSGRTHSLVGATSNARTMKRFGAGPI